MAFKRLLIEIGQGVDMHGADQNNAVRKATQDAIHHCCMAGLMEIFGMTDFKNQARIHADIYVPHPEQADPQVVIDYLKAWTVDAEVHQGGANPRGIALNNDPETEITVALVVLTVYVEA
jgi:uncharacterized protein (TIGR02058 family)